MEKAFIFGDLKSFECSSLSELDRRLLEEQGLLSALSLEQSSSSKNFSCNRADGFEGKPSILASLCLSSDPISPCGRFSPQGSKMQEVDGFNLTVPLQRTTSTPQELFKKNQNTMCFDQSYCILTTSQISWDVSLIKSESDSPWLFLEASTQELTASPRPQQQLLPE